MNRIIPSTLSFRIYPPVKEQGCSVQQRDCGSVSLQDWWLPAPALLCSYPLAFQASLLPVEIYSPLHLVCDASNLPFSVVHAGPYFGHSFKKHKKLNARKLNIDQDSGKTYINSCDENL